MIDDDPTILDTLQALLSDAGFTVLSSKTAAKGLDLLRNADHAVNVVILDYQLPGLNGAEMLTHMRAISPHAKVIGLSGVDYKFLPQNYRDGVDHFINKPFSTGQLIQTIRELSVSAGGNA